MPHLPQAMQAREQPLHVAVAGDRRSRFFVGVPHTLASCGSSLQVVGVSCKLWAYLQVRP